MSRPKRTCFVIMPFLPELNYFFLYMRDHIRQMDIDCERADSNVTTGPLLEKIVDLIQRADVIIADCSGRNANVFYELGIAHALGKKVILLTKDDVKDAPTDIRHYEFIRYQLDKEEEFFNRLDNALRNVFAERYNALYDRAERIFAQFKAETGVQVEQAVKHEFIGRVMAAEKTAPPFDLSDQKQVTEFVLPRIVADSNDVKIMRAITDWIASRA